MAEDGFDNAKRIMIRKSGTIQTYRDLEVYRLAFTLQQAIFKMTKTFPKEENYSLTDQIRRSSRSVGANLSEAWAKRRYPASFLSKLTDSDGEAQETGHWLDTALSCDYISNQLHLELCEQLRQIGAMLGKMISNHESWCKPSNT